MVKRIRGELEAREWEWRYAVRVNLGIDDRVTVQTQRVLGALIAHLNFDYWTVTPASRLMALTDYTVKERDVLEALRIFSHRGIVYQGPLSKSGPTYRFNIEFDGKSYYAPKQVAS